jgi:Zn-dependent protease/predicted transcriptional regulator
MASSIRIGRVLGVEIGVHWSWAFIFLIITWSFATGVFAHYYEGWTDLQRWAGAVVVSGVFFLSVLIHEMSHAVVSNRLGLPVRSITLFVFGGAANLSKEPEAPGDEFRIAVVGPLSSLVLGLLFAVGWLALRPVSNGISGIVGYLALINVSLALFNMLPGFPLDGGRVFRSVVWSRNGDRLRATRTASRAGEWIAYGMMAAGVAELFFTGLAGGLWLLLIGFFLRSTAVASYEQLLIETTLSGIPVGDVMRRDVPRVPAGITIETFVHDHLLAGSARAFGVMVDDRLAGLITLADARRVPRADWPATTVRQAMTSADHLLTVEAQQCLTDALRLMVEHDVNQVPVMRGQEIAGVLDRSDVMRYIQVRRELDEAGASQATTAVGAERDRGEPRRISPRAS